MDEFATKLIERFANSSKAECISITPDVRPPAVVATAIRPALPSLAGRLTALPLITGLAGRTTVRTAPDIATPASALCAFLVDTALATGMLAHLSTFPSQISTGRFTDTPAATTGRMWIYTDAAGFTAILIKAAFLSVAREETRWRADVFHALEIGITTAVKTPATVGPRARRTDIALTHETGIAGTITVAGSATRPWSRLMAGISITTYQTIVAGTITVAGSAQDTLVRNALPIFAVRKTFAIGVRVTLYTVMRCRVRYQNATRVTRTMHTEQRERGNNDRAT